MTNPVNLPSQGQAITDPKVPAKTSVLRLDRVWRIFLTEIVTLLNREARPGSLVYLHEDADTDGYLRANGQAVSRTLYAALFAVYGTDYGAGDSSTTFNLPTISAISPSSGPDFLAYVKV